MPRLRLQTLLHGRPLGLNTASIAANTVRWSSTSDETSSPPSEPTTTPSTESNDAGPSEPASNSSSKTEFYPWSRTPGPPSKKPTPWLVEASDIDLTSSPYKTDNLDLPLPPLLTRPSLSIKHSHLHPKARLVPQAYSSRIYRNPYASMLASSIRSDSLEGARLPRFFLLQFMIRQHPLTNENWIVPVHIDPDEPEHQKGCVVGESAYLQCNMRYIQYFSGKGKQDIIFTPEVRDQVGKMVWRRDMDVFILMLLRKRVLRELMNCRLGREEAARVARELHPDKPSSWVPVRWDKRPESEFYREEEEMEAQEDAEVEKVAEVYKEDVDQAVPEEREKREKKDVELLWRYPDPDWKPLCFETYPMGPMFGSKLEEVKKILGVKQGEFSTVLKVFDRRNTEAIKWLYKLRMYIRQK